MSNPSNNNALGVPEANRPHGILRNPSSQHRQPSQKETVLSLNVDQEDNDDNDAHSETGTYEDAVSGRWGEGPSHVNVIGAEKDFKKLERQLTKRSSIYRTQTGEKTAENQGGDFDLTDYLKDIIPRAEDAGIKRRNLGVTWDNLEVLGEGVGAQYISTFADPFIGLSNLINPYFWAKKAFSKSEAHPKTVTRTIIHPMNGFCKDGEMILVLGRPGAGCSTLLRVLANDRKNYKAVSGFVNYGPFTADEIAQHHRGEVLYNQEGTNFTQMCTSILSVVDYIYLTCVT